MSAQRSMYYEMFRNEEAPSSKSLYESLILLIPKDLRIDSDFGLGKKYQDAIDRAQLYLKTRDIVSFAIYTAMIGTILILGVMLASQFSLVLLGAMSFLLLAITGGVLVYPILQANRVKMLIVGQSPLAILYMVISLRVTPTLENALSFASRNVPDPIGKELRRIMWQVQARVYNSVSQALYDYSASIKAWAPGFSDALYLLASSVEQPSEQDRVRTLEKSMQISLDNTTEIMETFARNLSLPVMATNALGIILPVLGLVMAPMASIFSETTNMSLILTVVYDIVLPVVLIGLVGAILSTRPGSFSSIDLSKHPELKSASKINIMGVGVSPEVLAIILFVLLASPTLFILVTDGLGSLFSPSMSSMDSLKTLPFLSAIGLSVGLYLYLGNKAKLALVNQIRTLEREFTATLYQLANVMQQGMPLEEALRETMYALKGTKSSEFFRIAVENIEEYGLAPKIAILDEKVGAIRKFPSSLVRNVLEIILDASQRSTLAASSAAQSISVYLQNVQKVEEKINDLLSESISSMKFQSYILIPMISGVVVGLSQLITQILLQVAEQMKDAFAGSSMGVASVSMVGGLLNIKGAVPPSYLQLVVGFYTIETLTIIGAFSGGLERGTDDKIGIKSDTGNLITVGSVVYAIVTAFVAMFFSGMASMVVGG